MVNHKERVFTIISNLDPSFKNKLNESIFEDDERVDNAMLNKFVNFLPDNFPELVRKLANDKNIGLDSSFYMFIGAYEEKFEKNNNISFNISHEDDFEVLFRMMYGKYGDNTIEF